MHLIRHKLIKIPSLLVSCYLFKYFEEKYLQFNH